MSTTSMFLHMMKQNVIVWKIPSYVVAIAIGQFVWRR
jgi:hypothetical protein